MKRRIFAALMAGASLMAGVNEAVADSLPPIFAEHDRIIAAGVAVEACQINMPALTVENFRRRAEAVSNSVIEQIGQLKPGYPSDKVVAVLIRHQAQVDGYVRAKVASDGCNSADVRQLIEAYRVEAGASGGGVGL